MFNVKTSPIFNLSMASKELFHSNMLYWISIAYRNKFVQIMNYLGVSTNKWPDDWVAHREKEHFDLSITDKENKQYYLILENKVKSIPYKEQLKRYSKKIKTGNPELVLLSLSTNLIGLDQLSGWKIKHYIDLASAIVEILPDIHDFYHRMLLEDYFLVIKRLHELQKEWKINDIDSYIGKMVNADKEIEALGLDDMYKKVLYSQLAAKVMTDLHAKISTNKEILNSQEEGEVGEVYVNWGMTRSTGLLDVKTRIHDNLLFVIQVQGSTYRHCVETLDKEINEFNLDVIKVLKDYLGKKEVNQSQNNIAREIAESNYFKRKDEDTLNGYPFDRNQFDIPNSKEYNQFGETFIYQYIKLKDEVTISYLINAIKQDVNKLRKLVNDYKP